MMASSGKLPHARTRRFGGRAAGGLVLAGAVASALAGAAVLQAQGIAAHDSRAPVSFDAGSIAIDDRANRVVLSGGVVVEQAGLTVRSQRMTASYTDENALDVQRITANGGVVVTRGNERASGDVAVYDFGRRIITMAGNVRLRRGSDTLSGGRLVIDLASGLSSVDGRASGGASTSGSSGGRVRGTFTVPQD